jgi:hypothetical protein
MRKTIALLIGCGLLQACAPHRPAVADLAGTYAAQMGGCSLRLTLGPQLEYVYEKQCGAGKGGNLSYHGRWAQGPADAAPAVELYGFELGLVGATPARPDGYWSVAVVRGWLGLGAPRLCLDLERSYCLSR